MNKERGILEKTYLDICSVYGFHKVKEGGVTKTKKGLLLENVKCALSQVSLPPTGQNMPDNKIDYDAKLFLPPDIVIPAGSEVHVKRHGITYEFISSGEAFPYVSHQEIKLKRLGRA